MGRLDEAAVAFAAVLPHIGAFPRHTVEWIIATTSNVDLCIRLDHTAPLPSLYADLLPFADRQATGRAQSPSAGPVALYLGKLACAMEDWAAAEVHLHHALYLCAVMGSPPFEAMTRVELARIGLARRGPADARDAQAHLETAIEIARRLGVAPLAKTAATCSAQDGDPSLPATCRYAVAAPGGRAWVHSEPSRRAPP